MAFPCLPNLPNIYDLVCTSTQTRGVDCPAKISFRGSRKGANVNSARHMRGKQRQLSALYAF